MYKKKPGLSETGLHYRDDPTQRIPTIPATVFIQTHVPLTETEPAIGDARSIVNAISFLSDTGLLPANGSYG